MSPRLGDEESGDSPNDSKKDKNKDNDHPAQHPQPGLRLLEFDWSE